MSELLANEMGKRQALEARIAELEAALTLEQHTACDYSGRIAELQAEVEYLGRSKRELTAGLMQQIETLGEETAELKADLDKALALLQKAEAVMRNGGHGDRTWKKAYAAFRARIDKQRNSHD